MTEQVTCHEFTGVIWQCSTTESDLVLCPEGYCPTCGTKLMPDGTTQAMVTADALRKLAQVMSSEDICPAGTVLEHEIHCHKGEDGDCNTAEMQACLMTAALAATKKTGGNR